MYWWEHLEVQDDVVILFFLLLTLTPCVYVILSRRWSVPLEDLTSKEKDPHVQVGKSLPLCLEEWIVAFVKSCLLVIAPDFRIPPQKKFFFFPSCAFPSRIVSEHNNSTYLHCEVDIVTENRPETFSLVKLDNALWMYYLQRNPCSFYLLMLSACWRINFE